MTEINVNEHIGLVHLCASKFKNKGEEYEDLFSIGCIGLVKAANSFDSSLGYKFSTFAVSYILGEIKHYFRDKNVVRVSRSIKENYLKISASREFLEKKFGREATVSEISNHCGLSDLQIIQALETDFHKVNFEDSDGNSLFENISSDENIEINVTKKLLIKEIFKMLDDDEKKIIYLRYFKDLTQTQTAKVLDMYQVQVSRKEKKILQSLKKQLQEN
jgi:RNA polymerase sporulation-specific sigma factor